MKEGDDFFDDDNGCFDSYELIDPPSVDIEDSHVVGDKSCFSIALNNSSSFGDSMTMIMGNARVRVIFEESGVKIKETENIEFFSSKEDSHITFIDDPPILVHKTCNIVNLPLFPFMPHLSINKAKDDKILKLNIETLRKNCYMIMSFLFSFYHF
ncbi:hypothetical protein RND81_O264000 [Saponaria officinalis]